jgi:hypothetical protein
MTRMLLASVHVCHTCAFHGQSLYVVTFHADPTELDRFTAYEKKCSLLHLSARMGGLQDPSQFLYQHNHWSSVLKTNICWWTYYIDLLDPYHQHVINTFNIFSRGPTHRSLTDTDGATTLEVPACHITLPDPPNRLSSIFHLKGPTRSQVVNPTITNWTRDATNPKSHEWKPLLDFYHKLSSKHSMC